MGEERISVFPQADCVWEGEKGWCTKIADPSEEETETQARSSYLGIKQDCEEQSVRSL
jgi:hypothetical protein